MNKLPRLIGICGKARSGKDVASQFLVDTHQFHTYKMAAPIKRALAAMFQVDPEFIENQKEDMLPNHVYTPRELLQTMGTEWGRDTVGMDIWLDFLRREWDEINQYNNSTYGPLPGLVISDIRFDNEADYIRRCGGVVIRVLREDADDIRPHKSEAGIRPNLIDQVVRNDSDINTFIEEFVARLNLLSDLPGVESAVYL